MSLFGLSGIKSFQKKTKFLILYTNKHFSFHFQSRYFDCDDSDSYSDISNLEINERNQDTTSINNFAAGADIDVGGLHVAPTEGDYDEVDEDDVDDGDVDNCYRERRALGSSDGIDMEEDIYKRECSDTHSVYELHNDDIIA